MNPERIVVLGVGNTLLKDEGVGVRVVEECNVATRCLNMFGSLTEAPRGSG